MQQNGCERIIRVRHLHASFNITKSIGLLWDQSKSFIESKETFIKYEIKLNLHI